MEWLYLGFIFVSIILNLIQHYYTETLIKQRDQWRKDAKYMYNNWRYRSKDDSPEYYDINARMIRHNAKEIQKLFNDQPSLYYELDDN